MAGSYYLTAQVCLNGHTITNSLERSPNKAEAYCSICSERTITKCPDCNTQIRGYYYVPGVLDFAQCYSPPSFCHNCGKPFPWTISRLEAAIELADLQEKLNQQEIESLKQDVQDIIKDTPKATIAATRFKKIMLKIGETAAQGFHDILVDIASETAKKIIWPS